MKAKTSITLSRDLMVKVDRETGAKVSRSAFIENVLRAFFREKARKKLHARDLALINAAADRLNAEMADVLEYQAVVEE